MITARFPGVRIVNFGHLGDGNLHYNVQPPREGAAGFIRTHADEVAASIYAKVRTFGGSISAEHGVGATKVQELALHKPTVALDMMRPIKRALDPCGIINPGRIIQAEGEPVRGS